MNTRPRVSPFVSIAYWGFFAFLGINTFLVSAIVTYLCLK